MKKGFVTACNSSFFPGAKALLLNIAHWHPDVKRYCFVLPNEVDQARHFLGDIADILPHPRKLKGVPENMQKLIGKIFSVYLTEDVVVYMDADIIVCRPVSELWNIENGKINAIRDKSQMVSHDIRCISQHKAFVEEFPEVALKKGFNGGVFALAPKQWLDLPERFEALFSEGKYDFAYIRDQVALNLLIMPNVHWLPFTYNAHHLYDHFLPFNVRVVHFTGDKPWTPKFSHQEPQYWYWLKYGFPKANFLTLLFSAFWIMLNTPKRIFGHYLRMLGLRK